MSSNAEFFESESLSVVLYGEPFFALAVYCNLCDLHVKRDAIYYTASNGGKQSYICPRCFRGARGESIEVEGFQVFKSNFVEKKNIDELNEE
ncbi:hypothetical protein AMTR_s03073p00008220, partial [Amborella trichopoda]